MPVADKLNTLSIRASTMDPRVTDVFQRLRLALCSDIEVEILGESLLEEVVFTA